MMEFGDRAVRTSFLPMDLRFMSNLLLLGISPQLAQQQGGHQDILTSPLSQLISGLCLYSCYDFDTK
jgi:hypothetical protein